MQYYRYLLRDSTKISVNLKKEVLPKQRKNRLLAKQPRKQIHLTTAKVACANGFCIPSCCTLLFQIHRVYLGGICPTGVPKYPLKLIPVGRTHHNTRHYIPVPYLMINGTCYRYHGVPATIVYSTQQSSMVASFISYR